MKVGIPKSLLYFKYHPFIDTFFYELGAELVYSDNTNNKILNLGVKYCVDEACLPMKIFHGHVASLKDQCDLIVVPRIMQLREREFICPKFCGLPEMLKNSIPDLPQMTDTPIYAYSKEKLLNWAIKEGKKITKNNRHIIKAFNTAYDLQTNTQPKKVINKRSIKIALAGHPYNLYDSFVNMNLIKKLDALDVDVITEETISNEIKNLQIANLFKRPFWTFAIDSYGFTTYLAQDNRVDGIIYVSSFACGIDSVVIELIKQRVHDFPMLILKLDEHTGEAGLNTRIEAFLDLLERRKNIDNHISSFR